MKWEIHRRIQQWKKCWTYCINSKGNHFEGDNTNLYGNPKIIIRPHSKKFGLHLVHADILNISRCCTNLLLLLNYKTSYTDTKLTGSTTYCTPKQFQTSSGFLLILAGKMFCEIITYEKLYLSCQNIPELHTHIFLTNLFLHSTFPPILWVISHILISVNFCAAHHKHTGNCTIPHNGQSVYFYATQYYLTVHTDDTKPEHSTHDPPVLWCITGLPSSQFIRQRSISIICPPARPTASTPVIELRSCGRG